MAKKPNNRFTRDNWLELGLVALGGEGVSALTVERMCAAAQKTRGSFYHHFEDHNAFVLGLLEHWRETSTAKIIATVSEIEDPRQQRIALARQVVELSATCENSIRGWAGTDQRAGRVVRQVDEARIAFLQSGVEAMAREAAVKLKSGEAERLAMLDYGLFIGALAIKPEATNEYYLSLGALSEELMAAWMAQRAE